GVLWVNETLRQFTVQECTLPNHSTGVGRFSYRKNKAQGKPKFPSGRSMLNWLPRSSNNRNHQTASTAGKSGTAAKQLGTTHRRQAHKKARGQKKSRRSRYKRKIKACPVFSMVREGK